MDNTENLLPRLKETLERVLRELPIVSAVETVVEPPPLGNASADLLINLTLQNSTRHQLAVEFKSQGQPRQLRQAISQILLYRHQGAANAEPMVAAPYISDEGAEICRQQRINYCDIAGNCRLMFGGLFVHYRGNPNPLPRAVATPDLYAPKSERLLRVLLDDPLRAWKVSPLSKEAKVSLGTVSTIRKLLLDKEWAKESEAGIALTRADKLVQDWADVWGRRRYEVRRFLSMDGVNTAEQKLASAAKQHFPTEKFAITGMSAAWRHAQWVRYDHVLAYWTGSAEALAQHCGLKPAESGTNIHLLAPRDEGVFHGAQGYSGVPVVSPVQTYLDLKREPGRGAEAAEFLWNRLLFPGHATNS